jgi:alcohol dehydrogenase (cytochrome c)
MFTRRTPPARGHADRRRRRQYVTAVNECYALDAGSGRRIWHSASAIEGPRRRRGVRHQSRRAISGGRLFMVTDDARLLR